MNETTIIRCSCSQENHLVCIDGVWRRKSKKHGTDAVFNGKCFNCPKELATKPKGYTAPPAKGKAAAVTDVDRECMKGLVEQMERMEKAMGQMEGKVNGLTDEANRLTEEKDRLAQENRQLRQKMATGGSENEMVDLGKMSGDELRQYAGEKGIELPGGKRSKDELIEVIVAAQGSGGGE